MHFAGVTYPPGDTLEEICFMCISVAIASLTPLNRRPARASVGKVHCTALYFWLDADLAYVETMALNGRILIVEDDTTVREMLAEYLGTHGYEVAQADHGTAMRETVEKCLAGRRPARRQPPGRGRFHARALPARALRRRNHHGHRFRRSGGPRCRAGSRRRRLRREALRPARTARAGQERDSADAGAPANRAGGRRTGCGTFVTGAGGHSASSISHRTRCLPPTDTANSR